MSASNHFSKTLQDIVLDFLVQNIELLESLVGFPQVVGEEILRSCLRSDVLKSQNACSEAVFHLFVNAYESDMLGSFAIGEQDRRFIAKFGEFLSPALWFVSELSLSNCGLTADEILSSFGSFENLRVLDLSDNFLSDEGLRLLLARQKIFRNGFQRLQVLDLRNSHVDMAYLATLLRLPHLQRLAFSVCTAKLRSPIAAVAPKSGLCFPAQKYSSKLNQENFYSTLLKYLKESGFRIDSDSLNCQVVDSGALAPNLRRWMDDFHQQTTCRRGKESGSFYSRSSKTRNSTQCHRPVLDHFTVRRCDDKPADVPMEITNINSCRINPSHPLVVPATHRLNLASVKRKASGSTSRLELENEALSSCTSVSGEARLGSQTALAVSRTGALSRISQPSNSSSGNSSGMKTASEFVSEPEIEVCFKSKRMKLTLEDADILSFYT